MKTKELRDLTEVELRQKLDDLRQERFNLGIQQSYGQLEKPSRLRAVRRETARLLTVMAEKAKGAKTP
jgi:large subunit ribosomal protein L29